MASIETIVDRLAWHAARRPDVGAFVTWSGDERRDVTTVGELDEWVRRIAVGLAATGIRSGDRAVIALPNHPSFAAAVLGTMRVGAIPVPAPVPTGIRPSAFQERLRSIVGDCAPVLLITTTEWGDEISTASGDLPRIVDMARLEEAGSRLAMLGGSPTACDVALLQYTSGSTARPRGVVVTHAALMQNCHQAQQAYGDSAEDVAVTWVPVCHDMGLITGVIRPIHFGYSSVLMRPEEFVAAPGRWLRAISVCGGTLSSAPNFAYDLCVRRVAESADSGLDLQPWRVAGIAGEVVRAETISRFVARFAGCGFDEGAMCPSYGLAEATLVVTTCRPGDQLPHYEWSSEVPGQRTVVVSSGRPVKGTEVTIDAPGADGVGEILVRGPQVCAGYWGGRREPADRWLRTGDLGRVRGGELFVLGRNDDTLSVHGRKVYICDLVAACGSVHGVRRGRMAVFATAFGETQLVAEVDDALRADRMALARIRRQLQRAAAEVAGLYVAQVDLLPKTNAPGDHERQGPGERHATPIPKRRSPDSRARRGWFCASTALTPTEC